MDDWIIYSYTSNSKNLAEAVLFTNIREIEMDSKLSSGKLKRSLVYVFKDSTRLDVPDDAVFVQSPPTYRALVREMAQVVKV